MSRLHWIALCAVTFGWFLSPTLAAAGPTACDDIPGTTQVLERPNLRFVILGEIHGTVEAPKVFGEVVCAASQERAVTVSLEFPVQMQADLDAYMSGPGDDEAKRSLLSNPFWSVRLADGRSSQAMLNLLERLRRLRADGRDLQVRATRAGAGRGFRQDYTELLIAAEWVRAASDSRLVVALVGRAHAGKAPNERFRPAASFLPSDESLSFEMEAAGGQFWGCRSECGVQPYSGSEPGPAGIHLGAKEGGFDGGFSAPTLTASPPAVQAMQ